MVTIEAITPRETAAFKATRLRALQDAPTAFGSTYANESQLSDSDWVDKATQWSGDRSVGYLAIEDGQACGIAGCFLHRDDPSRAVLISMWVAPSYRGRGVGDQLVDSIIGWANSRRATKLLLMVTSNSRRAIRFYERLGFALTGHTIPYPNDSALMELEMARPISDGGQIPC
jgi:ribosomal protein S18 acetylase RimI-like enzyme